MKPTSTRTPSATPVRIGLLDEREIDLLIDLAGTIWRACYPGLISSEQIEYMLEQRYRPALLRQLMARGDRFWVARVGEELVGFAHAFMLAEHQCKLDKLYVRPDLQRHGIGALLMRHVENYARGRGAEWLVLRVNRRNEIALRAYRRYGFLLIEAVKEEIGEGFVMDDWLLGKALSSTSVGGTLSN